MRNWVGQSWRGFSPFDVPETLAWFSPRERVTNVSGAASAWALAAPPGGYTVSQATAGFRPAIANGINGQPTLSFNAASFHDLSNTSTNIITGGATRYVLAVVKSATAAGGCVMSFRIAGRVWALLNADIGGNRYYFTDATAISAAETGAGPDFTQPRLIEWELTVGAPVVVRVDGVARTLAVNGNLVAEDGTTGFRFALHAGAYTSEDIADAYIASGIPSATNLGKLRTFFSTANRMTPLV